MARSTDDENRDPPEDGSAALERMLASDHVWVAVDPGLEARVVERVEAEVQARPRHPTAPGVSDRPKLRIIAAIAAVFLLTGVVVALVASGTDQATGIALVGTDLADGARATAELDDTPSGLRVLLNVRGLPPAGAGRYYQAWMRNDAGDAVTIGTFHLNGGDAEIELWAGVRARDYPSISVTVQNEGEGAESSGLVVLQGGADG